MSDDLLPDYRTPFWDYPPVRPGVEYGPNRGELDWNVRWPARPAEHLLRAAVGVGRDGAPVLVDLRWHLVCTGSDRDAVLRTVLVALADWFSPDLVQFLVADFDNGLDPVRLVPHAATTALGPGTQEKALARAIDWEIWRRSTLTEHELANEPALVLAFQDVDRLIGQQPDMRDLLDTVGRDGGRLKMHLLMTATDPDGLPGTPMSAVDGHGSIGAQQFRLVTYTPDQLAEFSYTFMYYNHPARSLWTPPGGVTYERMMACDQGGDGIPLGILDDGLFTVLRHDFARKPHLIVRGAPGCGKTTTLNTVLRGLAAADAVVLNLDQVVPVLGRIRTLLVRRLADPEAWDGPELFIVVDDLDTAPLEPLTEFLRHGSSIGVHLVAAGVDLAGPVIEALADRTTVLLTDPAIPRNQWDTVASRFGLQSERPCPKPLGRAYYNGGRPEVQVAIDVAPPPLEFRPVDDLFAAGPVVTESLLAVIGAMDGGVPVKLDLREHTWCGGDFGMGKTTLLRRVAHSLAARYTPATVHLLVADAERLGDLALLPHTTEYTQDARHLTTLLDDELRRRLMLEEQGRLADTPHLVVLVDGAGDFIATVPAVGDTFRRIAAVGARVGMTLVLTERSPTGPLHEMISVRVSLPYVSDDAEARTLGVPKITSRRFAGPGAAYIRAGDGKPRSFMLAQVTPEEVREARFQKRVPAVRALPLTPPLGMLTYDELRHIAAAQASVPIGLDNTSHVVGIDFDREPHLVVTGPPGSGRSTVLRTLLSGIAHRYTARDCAVLLLHDNMIAGVLPPEHVLDTSPGFEQTMMDEVLTALRKRVGNPAWTGPRLFVAIDDLDLFAPAHDPLTAMREMIPHARQIGLHFLITGRRHPDLEATRLSLPDGHLPAGDGPALPALGHGLLGDQPVWLPWYQLPR